MNDFILILQMKQGNDQAFDKFVRKYYADILSYCRYHCLNQTEVLQEKSDDLERVKRYAGAEQIDTIISNVKEQERMEQQTRQYHRSYGAR